MGWWPKGKCEGVKRGIFTFVCFFKIKEITECQYADGNDLIERKSGCRRERNILE